MYGFSFLRGHSIYARVQINSHRTFRAARDFLLQHREDYDTAFKGFRWPEFEDFNWALDWFDVYAQNNHRVALHLVQEGAPPISQTFAELSERSDRVAQFFKRMGLRRGDRVLVMLPNVLPLWEIVLGAIKLGVVLVPTSTLATPKDLQDRVERGEIRLAITDETNAEKFATVPGNYLRCVLGKRKDWISYEESHREPRFVKEAKTLAHEPCLLYFTSGTTAKPKLVLHTHRSYPVGHLSTMFWIGIKEGDVHQNISSPGWAKHAWSSFFAPWNAGATLFVLEMPRFQATTVLHWLEKAQVNTLCAPPTVWRLILLETLGTKPKSLREMVSAGEPLNPEVIDRFKQAWGITIRDGYGQTETTAQIGNSPGSFLKLGSMGRPLPGYQISIVDSQGKPASEGEIAIHLNPRPAGLMERYLDDPDRTKVAMAEGFYRTGDEAARDEDGYIHFVGRGDDVFKSSDYRISPFELESVLIEHPAVAEAAVVPSPDGLKLSVPKAYVTLKPGIPSGPDTAKNILTVTNAKLAPYQKIRRIEFGDLPKTISGKIRRVELRKQEMNRAERDQLEHKLENLKA